MSKSRLRAYFATLAGAADAVEATDAGRTPMPLDDAVEWAIAEARRAHTTGHKLVFVGNGGSAAIASHMAIDYSKNGGMRALAFNDAAALTCLSNDLGYDHVFAKQIAMHGREGDLLVAISSSGRSPSILNAVAAAKEAGIEALTLSGFAADNPLRSMGAVNLYVPSGEYGFVEITHLALCHAILDLAASWKPANETTNTGGRTAAE